LFYHAPSCSGYLSCIGFSDKRTQERNDVDTPFLIGSIYKQFIAFSILLLEKDGLLSVGDRLLKYLPEKPPAWREITLEHLLSHTSGIPDYQDALGQMACSDLGSVRSNFVRRIEGRALESSPGSKMHYSNANYAILAHVVDYVSQEQCELFIAEHIFHPLGMSNCGFVRSAHLQNLACGNTGPNDVGLVDPKDITPELLATAGAMYASAHDLLIWEHSYYSKTMLGCRTFESVLEASQSLYAYGWHNIGAARGMPIFGHGGSMPGFRAYVLRSPADRTYIAVMSNYGWASAKEIAADLLCMVSDRD